MSVKTLPSGPNVVYRYAAVRRGPFHPSDRVSRGRVAENVPIIPVWRGRYRFFIQIYNHARQIHTCRGFLRRYKKRTWKKHYLHSVCTYVHHRRVFAGRVCFSVHTRYGFRAPKMYNRDRRTFYANFVFIRVRRETRKCTRCFKRKISIYPIENIVLEKKSVAGSCLFLMCQISW